jgi:uncharacterized phage protein (TIGR01671 family)
MREIKFRAWDFEYERFLESHELSDCRISRTGAPYRPDSSAPFNRWDKDPVFQQYTGLKDKNGVEIYEGDIIRLVINASEWHETVSREKFAPFVVRWSESLMGWFPESQNGYEPDETWWDQWDVEVIGNIYENPELLEAKS